MDKMNKMLEMRDMELYELTLRFYSQSYINIIDNQTQNTRLLFLKGAYHSINPMFIIQ